MPTICVLFSNFGPYHFARLEGFQKSAQPLGWNVIGIELSRIESTYAWRTETDTITFPFTTVIQDKSWEDVSFWTLVKLLSKSLSDNDIDVLVLPGYHTPILIYAMIWARFHGKRTILMLASKEDDKKRHFAFEYCKSLVIKNYQAALVGGSPQKRYLEKLVMPSDRIFIGYDVVDNDSFEKNKISRLKNPLEKPFFLTVNRFVGKKNLFWLLSVYADYRNQLGSKSWDLVLCGDGELSTQVHARIVELNLEKFVHCPGFLQRNEQLPYFAHAKCFIHSSTQEQWGLVVNEAMAASLPVLLSNRCGCFEDLLIEGENGFGFDPENAPQLLHLMLNVSCNTSDLTRLGDNARNHIEKFSPLLFGSNLVKAINLSM